MTPYLTDSCKLGDSALALSALDLSPWSVPDLLSAGLTVSEGLVHINNLRTNENNNEDHLCRVSGGHTCLLTPPAPAGYSLAGYTQLLIGQMVVALR